MTGSVGELGEASPTICCFSFTLRAEQKMKQLEGGHTSEGGVSSSPPCWKDVRAVGATGWDQAVKGLQQQPTDLDAFPQWRRRA